MKVSILFVSLTALFVTCLITATILSVKLWLLAGYVLPAGTVIFPLSYIFGDVLTEVYGYGAARVVVWLGFLCNLLVVVAIFTGGILPPAHFWHDQHAYDTILGSTRRVLAASFAAYLMGEFVNAYLFAKLKIVTSGRLLWVRAVTSTFVGQGLDTVVFITIAFSGIIPAGELKTTMLTQWLVKVGYEIIALPLTYTVVNALKRYEHCDVYDYTTEFNPLRFHGLSFEGREQTGTASA